MGAIAAFRLGIHRANGALVLLAGVYTMTLLIAFPLSLALRGMLEVHLGRSLSADSVATDTNHDW